MKQIPSTIVLSMLLLIIAAWPSIDAWGDTSLARHLSLHVCYLISGALIGLQMAWWTSRSKVSYQSNPESRVSS